MSAATVSYLARRAAQKEGVRLLCGRGLRDARNCHSDVIEGKPKVSSKWEFYSQKEQANGGVFDGRRNPFVTFVLGGPGSGKGTQCTRIAETFGFAHLSAGDLLREEISSNGEKGSLILNTIKEGGIVPSEVTIKLIKKAIEEGENRRFLIDGFPRSEENRIAYERVMGSEPDIVLFFDCPEEVMVDRVLNRNQGRIDDNIDTVKERLKVFAELSLPVIKHYSKRGKLYKIDGTGSEDEIFERVRPVFMHLDRSICSP